MFLNTLKNNRQKFAYIISRLFDPPVALIAISILIVSSSYYMAGRDVWFWGMLLFLFLGIFPLLFIFISIKKGIVKDIDFTDRKSRTPYMLAVLFIWFLGFVLSWSLAGPKIFLVLFLDLIAITLITLIINFYWKISNHAWAITALGMFVNILFSWQWWPLFLLVPLSCWSRYVQKKHTLWQLVGGVGLGILFGIILKLFKY